MNPNSRLYVLFLVFSLCLASLFVVPKWMVGDEMGLAAGGIAGVSVLVILFVSGVVALVMAALTFATRSRTSVLAKGVGLLPLLVTLCLGGALALKLSEERQPAESQPANPAPVTSPVDG